MLFIKLYSDTKSIKLHHYSKCYFWICISTCNILKGLCLNLKSLPFIQQSNYIFTIYRISIQLPNIIINWFFLIFSIQKFKDYIGNFKMFYLMYFQASKIKVHVSLGWGFSAFTRFSTKIWNTFKTLQLS